jgi:autoinducer 2 (AI-2) kinase
MTNGYLIGLDIGGGGGRCLLVNPDTGDITITFRYWPPQTMPQSADWGFDLNIDLLWRVLGEITKECITNADISAKDVVGIAATSMRQSVVVIDKEDKVLLATPNMDARAVSQTMALTEGRGDELYRRTGHWPIPIFMGPTLLWMAEEMPAELKAARSVMSISDWIAYKLTGNATAEVSQAAESLLFDLGSRNWAEDLVRSFNLPRGIFPRVVDAGTKVGELTADAAEHLGLKAGIPVAAGGADTQSGLLGTGAVGPGQLAVIAGTTTPIQLVTDRPYIDQQKRLWASAHVVPGMYVLESNSGGMGTALDWVARAVYKDSPDPVAALTTEAGLASPGADGIISTVGASVFNAAAMDLPLDTLTFSTTNKERDQHGRTNLARAVLEGMAYAVKANIGQILEVTGDDKYEISVVGGMSRSKVWTQIISDVIGKTVNVGALPEITALGAAVCAGVGAGVFTDLAAGAKKLHKLDRRHEPRQENAKIYGSSYQDWVTLRAERADADMTAASIITQNMTPVELVTGEEAITDFRPRIYVSADMNEDALDLLREYGDVTYHSFREGIMLVDEGLVETLQGYHVFVTEVDVVDAESLQELPDLRMIAVCRGNPVNVDIDACTAAGVLVINTPGRNADAVADLALSFILMLARKMQGASTFLRQPGGEAGDMGRMGLAYMEYRGHELWGKTIGLIGGGAIGRKVIKRLLPFDVTVLLYDPYITSGQAALMGAEKVSLDHLLTQSDFISLHAPVTDDTREMINSEAFDRMKDGVFLINTARAALVNNQDLIAALMSEKLAGAALDVFPIEPPGYDAPILAFPSVIATPHVGGNTYEVAMHQGMIVSAELKLLLAGKSPQYIHNPQVLEGFSWSGERMVSEEALEVLAARPGPSVSDLQVEVQKEEAKPEQKPQPEPAVLAPVRQEKKGGLLKRIFGKKGQTEEEPAPVSRPVVDSSQRRILVQILQNFTEKLKTDPQLAESSRGKDVILRFTAKDIDQTFYMSFVDGTVDAGLGESPVEANVNLKMSADILDGMFTGRINANRAAMTGKLSFSGDTRKAMSLQRFMKGISRMYQEARDEIGDPGDLTQIGVVPETPPKPVVQAAQPGVQGVSAPAVIMVGDVRDVLLQITNELFAKRLLTPTGGNVSVRVEGNTEEVWITPSAIFKGDLRADLMVKVDLDGNLIGENEYSASSERRMHCAIYRARPEVNAVLHTHAHQATLMAMAGIKFLPISTEAAFIGDIPVVPFIMPGTPELSEGVVKALGSGIAVILQNHGMVVAGSSLRRAADMTDVIELAAEKIMACTLMGVEPPVLPEDLVKELQEVGQMMA